MLRTLLLAALFSSASMAEAAPSAATPLTSDAARPYLAPAQLVEVEGKRRLNLVCMGDGPVTVLFDAGGSDWSAIWALVQPAVARRARACAYDRAGLGHSDPARGPRAPVAIVQDVHALIRAAGLSRPLVLVGHSLGGFNMKLYAALFPEDVAGLVLVDPSEDRTWDRTREPIIAAFGARVAARSELSDLPALAGLVEHYRDCAAAARDKPLDPSSLTYRRCSDPVRPVLGPEIAAMRLKIQVTPSYQATQASEIAHSIYGEGGADPIYARLFRKGSLGTMPIVVLTHEQAASNDPMEAIGVAQWLALHRDTAQLSRRGVQRIVPGTGHHIELEAPGAIVEAIAEVIGQVKPGSAK